MRISRPTAPAAPGKVTVQLDPADELMDARQPKLSRACTMHLVVIALCRVGETLWNAEIF